jgi:hypothetical protein
MNPNFLHFWNSIFEMKKGDYPSKKSLFLFLII